MSELVFKINQAKRDLLRPAYDRMAAVRVEHTKATFEMVKLVELLVDGPADNDEFDSLLDRFVQVETRFDALSDLLKEMQKVISDAEASS